MGVYLRATATTIDDVNQALARLVTFTTFTPASPTVVSKPAVVLNWTFGAGLASRRYSVIS